jgi:hypothetical protein
MSGDAGEDIGQPRLRINDITIVASNKFNISGRSHLSALSVQSSG